MQPKTQHFDILFITAIPAFYKVQLYDALGTQLRVGVIYLARTSAQRTADFYSTGAHVTAFYLSDGALESRSIARNLLKLSNLCKNLSTRMLVLGGWDAPEQWWALRRVQAAHKALALESSVHECQTTGLKGFIKRLFVSGLDFAFPSGQAHKVLLDNLGFQGQSYRTQGVGIFPRPTIRCGHKIEAKRFLYVGRLAPEKNLSLLLKVWHKHPHLELSIAGQGPLSETLRAQAPGNVHFLGHVANTALPAVYQAHDCFILPSLQEPWGLVVEEALYYSLPVIVSSQVGCAEDWVRQHQVGLVFEASDEAALSQAITRMTEPSFYEQCSARVRALDFEARDKAQVERYKEALSA